MRPSLIEPACPPQRRPAAASEILEFGRFRVLLCRRQLLADGTPVGLGTRAFDLLLVLLEADGSLVTKDELLNRVWPGIAVAEGNLKVQIAKLRKALGGDRDLIGTDFGRGYRFTAPVRSTGAPGACQHVTRPRPRFDRRLFARRTCRRSLIGWYASRIQFGGCLRNVSGKRHIT